MAALHTAFSYSITTVGRSFLIEIKKRDSSEIVKLSQIASSADLIFSEKRLREHLESLTDDLMQDFFPKERIKVEKKRKDVEIAVVIDDPVKAIRKAKKDAASSNLSWEERVTALAFVYQNTDFSKDERGFIFKDFGKLVTGMGKDASKVAP